MLGLPPSLGWWSATLLPTVTDPLVNTSFIFVFFFKLADLRLGCCCSPQGAFPGRRLSEVLLYCRTEVADSLRDQLTSSAQQLGDARKESPEELEERHERVVAASLSALSALLDVVLQSARWVGLCLCPLCWEGGCWVGGW